MKKDKKQGFTLVEMLVVIVIIGVIVLIAIPQFRLFYLSYKVKTATRMVLGDMRSARQTAATRNRPVMLSIYKDADSYYIKFFKLMDSAVPKNDISDATKWEQIGNTIHYFPKGVDMKLGDAAYTSFTDKLVMAGDTDTNVDIIFTEKGESYDYAPLTFTEPATPSTNPASYSPRITLFIKNKVVVNNHYFIHLSLAGRVQTVAFHKEVW